MISASIISKFKYRLHADHYFPTTTQVALWRRSVVTLNEDSLSQQNC